MRSVLRSFSRACPIIIVLVLMNTSRDSRMEAKGKTAVAYDSGVIPEKRVLKSLGGGIT